MKNLKIIATAFLLLFTFTSAFAQTKEETMAWLKEYGSEWVKDREGYTYVFKINNKNQLYFSETGEGAYYVGIVRLRYYIEPEDLKYLNIDDTSSYKSSNRGVYQYNLFFSKNVVKLDGEQTTSDGTKYLKGPFYNFTFYTETKEKGDKIIKAIVHLAKLYGAKPGSKVSEDMSK